MVVRQSVQVWDVEDSDSTYAYLTQLKLLVDFLTSGRANGIIGHDSRQRRH